MNEHVPRTPPCRSATGGRKSTLVAVLALLVAAFVAPPLDAQLTPKQQKQMNKLVAKHEKVVDKLEDLQETLAHVQAEMVGAFQQLVDALLLPSATPKQEKAKKKAIKAAKKPLKKATKRAAKLGKLILVRLAKIALLEHAIELLDPGLSRRHRRHTGRGLARA